jgi:hypothetical protein
MSQPLSSCDSGPSAGPLPSRPAIASGDRLRYSADEGSTLRGPSAGPLPSRPAIPSGDRLRYSADEGPT